MQKKSLLVALFCGALCLTGCLKNEESDSVAQVRIAKAKELTSIADLNTAKAQAELIYANAEATIAQAEAALTLAEAELVKAKAETEKVQAELLKVQVELAKVKVEEEKVKLKMMEADLESRLAALEVEMAAAEAAIQGWVNVLEDLIAKNEEQAVKNQHDLLKAQYELEAYILQQEGKKADSAKFYATKYFEALDSVAILQAKELQMKATKVLVNRQALNIRDFIYDQIAENTDQIKENKAKIDALKKYQTMDTEKAEAAVLEAMAKMNDAYNEYQDYVAKATKAGEDFNTLENKVSLFVGGSKPAGEGGWYNSFIEFIDTYDKGDVQNKAIQDYEDFAKVNYMGYYVGTGTNKTFVPLWKTEQELKEWRLYPGAVEQSVRTEFFQVQDMQIAPAEIFYKNIEGYLDTIVNRETRATNAAIATEQRNAQTDIEGWQLAIQKNNDSLALMKKYVDARKETITKLENEIASLVAQYNEGVEGLGNARKEYLDYMFVKYDIKRTYFENVLNAEADTVAEHDTLVAAELAYDLLEALIPGFEAAVETAKDNEAEAEGEYTTVKAVYDATYSTLEANLAAAEAKWNPTFAYEAITPVPDTTLAKSNDYYYYVIKTNCAGGDTQKAWLNALGFEKLQYERWQQARRDAAAHPTSADYQAKERTAYANYVIAGSNVDVQAIYVNAAKDIYNAAKTAVETASAPVKEAEKAWNPKFDKTTAKLVTDPDTKEKFWVDNNGNTPRDTAGTSQAATLYAQKDLDDATDQLTKTGEIGGKPTLKQAVITAKQHRDAAVNTYKDKFAELLTALGVKKSEYVEDTEVRRLYTAMKEAEDLRTTWEGKLDTLKSHYGTGVNAKWDGSKNEWTYVAPWTDAYDNPYATEAQDFNQRLGLSWLLCNYHMDYNYKYVSGVVADEKNPGKYVVEKQFAAIPLGYTKEDATTGKTVADPSQSIVKKNDTYNTNISKRPGLRDQEIARLRKALKDDITDKVAVVKKNLEEFPAYEADYNAWVETRQEAYETWVAAQEDAFDAKYDYLAIKVEYQAAKEVLDEGVWIYDPKDELYKKVYKDHAGWNYKSSTFYKGHHQDDFTFITIADEIERLEAENVTLQNQNEQYRQDLADGKVTLEYVNQIIDETLAVIQDSIQIWSAIAQHYKAVMNGYLDIVEDETGPLNDEDEE